MTFATARDFFSRALRIARTEIAALSALFIVAMGIVVFADLAGDMGQGDGLAFDQAVLSALRPHADPSDALGPWWLEEAAADLTSLGGIAVLGLFAVIVLLFLMLQRKHLSALLLIVGLTGGVALSEALKAVFERDRPPEVFQAVETINASFPSGHALLSAVFYLSIGVMLTRAFPRRRFKAYVLGVAIALTLIVGLTRVYLGAHWTTDVLAGWSVGSAWAMTLGLVAYGVQRRQAVHRDGPHDEPLPGEGVGDADHSNVTEYRVSPLQRVRVDGLHIARSSPVSRAQGFGSRHRADRTEGSPSKASSFMRLFLRLAGTVVMTVLLALMIRPPQQDPGSSLIWDKAAHFVAFGLILWSLGVLFRRLPRLWTALLAVGIGAAVELIQRFTGRDPSWGDLLADALGVAAALLAWAVWRRFRPREALQT